MVLLERHTQTGNDWVIARTFESAAVSRHQLRQTREVEDGREFIFHVNLSQPDLDVSLLDAVLQGPAPISVVRMIVRRIDDSSFLLKIVTGEPARFEEMLRSESLRLDLEFLLSETHVAPGVLR